MWRTAFKKFEGMPSTDFIWSILEYFVPYVRKLHFIRLFLVHIPSFGSGRHNSGLRATQYGGKYDRRYLVFGEYNPDEDETKYVDYLHFSTFFYSLLKRMLWSQYEISNSGNDYFVRDANQILGIVDWLLGLLK